jgi:hypothetical protein
MAVRHETSTNPPRQFLLVFDVAGKTQLQRLTSDNLGTHGCNIYQIRIGGPGGITHRAGRAIVITPLLALVLGVDIRYAIGASLISVIATSSGAAAAYVKKGISNIRIGMLMEIATTLGAVLGASLALHIPTSRLGVA